MFVHAPIYLFVNLRTPVSLRVYSSLMFHTRHVRILFDLAIRARLRNHRITRQRARMLLKRKITEYRSCRYASSLKKR